jgi:hypothetical protein
MTKIREFVTRGVTSTVDRPWSGDTEHTVAWPPAASVRKDVGQGGGRVGLDHKGPILILTGGRGSGEVAGRW